MIEIPGDDGPGQQRSNGKSVLNVARRSNLRGDLFQPDQAGERADFLILAQLEQERHRGRFQLLEFFGAGIDRDAGGFRMP
jgi:hypothetical protein